MKLLDKMMRMVDRIDVLCNNAGIGHAGSIKGRFHIVFVLLSFLLRSNFNTDIDATTDLDRVVKVNINGVFNCAKKR